MARLGNGIADPAHVLDQPRAQLLAQPVDVHFDGVAVDVILPSIELGFELRTRQHRPGTGEQRFEDGPFARRQGHAAPVDRRLAQRDRCGCPGARRPMARYRRRAAAGHGCAPAIRPDRRA